VHTGIPHPAAVRILSDAHEPCNKNVEPVASPNRVAIPSHERVAIGRVALALPALTEVDRPGFRGVGLPPGLG